MSNDWERVKVLITVKTYPIPSAKYDELVCTAGVREDGSFIRLYPINFRDLDYARRYRKYQWIEADVAKHVGRDVRKESYRPKAETIRLCGEPIGTGHNWAERARYVLQHRADSLEHLWAQQEDDKTSLGIFRPKRILDLVVSPDDAEWKPGFLAQLDQARIWEDRIASKTPPRKLPFKFQYRFECNDTRCKGKHRVMIEDWELGSLFWKCVDGGATQREACQKVKDKFLGQVCGPDRDTHFYVGTILAYPKSWVIIGVWWPKLTGPDLQLGLGF